MAGGAIGPCELKHHRLNGTGLSCLHGDVARQLRYVQYFANSTSCLFGLQVIHGDMVLKSLGNH